MRGPWTYAGGQISRFFTVFYAEKLPGLNEMNDNNGGVDFIDVLG